VTITMGTSLAMTNVAIIMVMAMTTRWPKPAWKCRLGPWP